jgi:tetrahydromethanopterin S-methyltransferase subunit E
LHFSTVALLAQVGALRCLAGRVEDLEATVGKIAEAHLGHGLWSS